MTRTLPREIWHIIERIGNRIGARPARDVALWLACIPLVLPAPLFAGIIAISERSKGSKDARWNLVLVISALNFLLSAAALAALAMLLGDWMLDRIRELPWIFHFWLPEPEPRSIPV